MEIHGDLSRFLEIYHHESQDFCGLILNVLKVFLVLLRVCLNIDFKTCPDTSSNARKKVGSIQLTVSE